jgi:hypothetical protein
MTRRFAILVCVVLLAVPAAWAQVSTGQISGVVYDASGAVLPNAQVTVSHPETGLSRTTTSNDTGNYAFTLLPPGKYELKIEAQGFSTQLRKDVTLAVGQQLTLNVTLQPGAVALLVTVTEEQPLIELTRSEIGGSVSPLEVKELPILDRNFAGLTYIVPGMRPAEGFDPTKTRVGNFTLNGGDGRSVVVNVDGADNRDTVVGGQIQAFTLEGIQEFNVLTNRYSADSGRTLGAVINVVTKSGTNDFHGSVFGLFQSLTFNKDDVLTGEPATPQHRYHFGGSAGGAIIKDKLFAFGSYEQKREPGTLNVDPDAFTELSVIPIADPVSTLPFEYVDHLLTFKVDHQVTDRQNMFYRYGRQRWTQPNDQLGLIFNSDGTGGTNNTNQFHDFVIGHNYVFGGNKVNSFAAHFQDFVNQITANPLSTFTLNITGGGSVTNPEICFIDECGAGLPEVEIGNNINVPQQTLIRKYQLRDDFSWIRGRHNMKMGVNYIYIAKMGGFFAFSGTGYQLQFVGTSPSDIAAVCPNFDCTADVMGLTDIFFTGGESGFKQRPHQLALYFQDDFKMTPRLTLNLGLRWDANIKFLGAQLTGNPSTSNRVVLLMREVLDANPSAAEAQEGLGFIRDIWGDEAALRRTTASWKEFQPRIGFAWDPTGAGKHVIRGGYGIAFDQVFQNLTLFGLQLSNPTIYTTVLSCSGAAVGGCPDFTTYRPFVDPLPAPPAFSTELPTGASPVRISDPHLTDPYGQQWSLGWAWEFHPDWAFSADYYHVLGIHESRTLNVNPRIRTTCDPAYGGNLADPRCVSGATTRLFSAAFQAAGFSPSEVGEIRMIATNNRSRYDGANFVLRKRFSHSYMMQLNYVLSWSRSWGGVPTASYGGTGIRTDFRLQFAPGEFGPTLFDERHRVVWSGHFELPLGFELSPVYQGASARPYNMRAGFDINGDGVSNRDDRACAGSTPSNIVLAPNACPMVRVNPVRGDALSQLDLRIAKAFRFYEERMALRLIYEVYNLFDTNNFGNNINDNASDPGFGTPNGYFGGQGFGAATSGPLRSQFGFRLEW